MTLAPEMLPAVVIFPPVTVPVADTDPAVTAAIDLMLPLVMLLVTLRALSTLPLKLKFPALIFPATVNTFEVWLNVNPVPAPMFPSRLNNT